MRSAVTNVAYTKPVLLAVRGRARLSQRAAGVSARSAARWGQTRPTSRTSDHFTFGRWEITPWPNRDHPALPPTPSRRKPVSK